MNLDIAQIADSGQIFRFNNVGDNKWELIAGDRYWLIDAGRDVVFPDEYWKHFFDMETDYGRFVSMIPETDQYLTSAARATSGIRILNQDPWEMLISFIISQRKSIPAIKTSVEKLCRRFGTPMESGNHRYYAFPTPEQLAGASLVELEECSLGYRAPYIYEASQKTAAGEYDLESWRLLSDDVLRAKLMSIKGVGIKVANCVMLFGYHRIGAFPVDVWIQKIMDKYYDGRFPVEKYEGCAGVMQQYMFLYERQLSNKV